MTEAAPGELNHTLKGLAAHHPVIGDVRGLGLLLGLELVRDVASRESFPREVQVAEKARKTCLDRGLLLYTGVGGTADIMPRDYLLIAPPFVMNRLEMEELLDKLDASLTEVEAGLL